jgi:hypothetical protein
MNMNYRRIIPCLKNTGSHMMLVGLRIKSRKSSASGKEHESLNLWLERRGGSAVSQNCFKLPNACFHTKAWRIRGNFHNSKTAEDEEM